MQKTSSKSAITISKAISFGNVAALRYVLVGKWRRDLWHPIRFLQGDLVTSPPLLDEWQIIVAVIAYKSSWGDVFHSG